MDYQTKTMIVNALTRIVDEAPTKPIAPYTQPYGVTKERFDIWVNYIFSVMSIISSYVDVSNCLLAINNVTKEPNFNNEYSLQVNSICKIILEFARSVLNL